MKKCPRCFIPGCFDLRSAETLDLYVHRRGSQIKFAKQPKLALICQMCKWFVVGVIEGEDFVVTDTEDSLARR